MAALDPSFAELLVTRAVDIVIVRACYSANIAC